PALPTPPATTATHPLSPTRRSSDLARDATRGILPPHGGRERHPPARRDRRCARVGQLAVERELSRALADPARRELRRARLRADRAEEHTSELQSRENLVCRLLLEKK